MFVSDLPSSVRVWPAIVRAVSGRCPACGGGKFFKSYLHQVDRCFVCDESFGQIHADDGPAWLTIGIVGHVVVPMALFAETNFQWTMTADAAEHVWLRGAATGHRTNVNIQTDVRSYSSMRGMSFACDAL